MLSEELRLKIEALNRQPLPTARSAPQHSAIPAPHFFVSGNGSLTELLPGIEQPTPSGVHYRVRTPLETFWPQAAEMLKLADAAASRASQEASSAGAPHVELTAFGRHFPASTMFLDLETCGFAGSMVFLIGLVWHDGEAWVLDQLLARHYSEERAIFETLWSIAENNPVLVTFNGKSFDWPMVLDRSTLHRLIEPAAPRSSPEVHCDLLHHVRRKWKHLLPNCKLQTLEQLVCKRRRQEDISGADIPVAYHQFVGTGKAREVCSIMHHNAMDLVTLVELSVKLAADQQAFAARG